MTYSRSITGTGGTMHVLDTGQSIMSIAWPPTCTQTFGLELEVEEV